MYMSENNLPFCYIFFTNSNVKRTSVKMLIQFAVENHVFN